MKCIFFSGLCCLVIAGSACAGQVVFPVVGEYDGSAQGNVVDRNAEFYEGNSSGEGNNAKLVLNIAAFRDEIRTAFSNDCGGVVTFDNELIEGGTQTDSFVGLFAKEKRLVIQSVDHVRTDFVATNICMPVSGPGEGATGGFLAKSVVGKDRNTIRSSFNFSFVEEGFGENEHVQAVAGTILGRNGTVEASKWLMKVQLDNGDTVAQIADINFRSGNSRDDTFFGARAPKGRYITGVLFLCLDGTYSGLDSLAFITNGEPQKPHSKPSNTGSLGNFFGLSVDGSGSGSSSSSTNEPADSYSLLFGSER